MTVLQVIQKSAEFLSKKGVESPRLQAEMMLAQVLNLPRMKLYLDFERRLSPGELDTMREWVSRRGRREPLQHIVGSTSFCGLEIAVDRRVLIPRPETEVLAELAWQFLLTAPKRSEGGSTRNAQQFTALDFGTGSGCLAIALAVKCPQARIVALDASAEALEVASRNAARNGVADRIRFLPGTGLTALPAGCTFELIVSNPPYIPSAEIQSLQPEVRDFDPPLALDGGADGLDCIRLLAREAPAFLKAAGRIMIEFGDGQAGAVRGVFESQNWIVEAVKEDYAPCPRFLIARRE